jgi:FG-GAP-like repeat/RTX calcium-binding nonapeptide repeat (4 copies)
MATVSVNSLRVSNNLNGHQSAPMAIATNDGGWTIYWIGSLTGSTADSVLYQRYNANGEEDGAEGVLLSGPAPMWATAAASFTSGGGVIGLQTITPGTFDSRFVIQRLDPYGAATGVAVFIDLGSTSGSALSLETLSDGRWLVALGGQFQVFNPDGTIQSAWQRLATEPNGFDANADIVRLSDGGWIATWTGASFPSSPRPDSSLYGIYQRRFDSSGTALTDEVLVNTTTADEQRDSKVLSLADGGWVVVWINNSSISPNGVYQQRYDATGARVGNETLVARRTGTDLLISDVQGLSDGGWLVALTDVQGATSSVFLKDYDAMGMTRPVTPPFASALTGLNEEFRDFRLSPLQNGAFVATASVDPWDIRTFQSTTVTYATVYQTYLQSDGSPKTVFDGDATNNSFIGSNAGETFAGLAGDDSISAGGGKDLLYGDPGNDTLDGGAGNDTLDGGAGIDTAAFSGSRLNYGLAKSGGNYVVKDLRGGSPDGVDTLIGVERFQFAGGVTLAAETFTPVNFNGDLNSDILWCNTAGLAVNFLMNGTALTGAGAIGGANGAAWRVNAVGDLNGDGASDLIWQDTSGLVVSYLMNGSSIASAAVVGNPGAAFRVVGSGDLNGDGQSDIVLQDNNGQAVVWFMNGSIIASAAAIGAANGAAWSVAAIGDLNRDGRADLAWEHTDGTTVGYLMSGSAISSAAVIAGANGAAFSVKGIGDLNGDGRGDIIWQFSNGQAGAWLMNGTTITAGNAIGGANGTTVEIRDVADLNGDGKMDLVWQNTTNGQAIGFLMNGTTITSAGLIGGANGADWFIV